MALNYGQDLQIDPDALDLEWLNQPMLMFNYSKELASANKEVDRLKENIDVVAAELAKDIREEPDLFGIEKITDTQVKATTIIQKKYKKVFSDWIDAKYEASMIKGAVQAVEQRKQALENLVKLHGQSYFAGPKEPRDLRSEVNADIERRRSNDIVANKIGMKRKTKS